MKKSVLFLLGIISLLIFSPHLKAQQTNNYKKQWEQVDKYMSKSLPKSALKIINNIYADATKTNNQDQILKCDIYFFKTKQSYEENYFEILIAKLEKDLKKAPFPNSAMIHYMLGDLYWQYYQEKKWQISGRTEISDIIPNDLKTWSVENIIAKSILHYRLSIEKSNELKKYKPDFYNETIKKGTKPKYLRPTLYDFLAAQTINAFSTPELSITRPKDYFQISNPKYYSDIATFAYLKIKSTDTLSIHYQGIKILQQWIKFRLEDPSNINALIDVDLKRLQYVNNFSVVPDKDNLYIKALKRIIQKNPKAKQTAYAKLQMAKFYFNKASKYDYKKPNTIIYKPYYAIAKNLLEGIVKTYPNNKEVKGMAKNFIRQITLKNLTFKNIKVYLPYNPIDLLLKYKNINKVFVEVRKISNTDYDDIINKYYRINNRINALRTKTNLVKSYSFDLKTNKDFQHHSTELLLNGLPVGGYVILISNEPNFQKAESIVNYNFIQVSNLSIIQQQQTDGSLLCYILNRKNSQPVVNAVLETYYSKYDYHIKKYIKVNYGTYKTDKNGKIIIPSTSKNWTSLDFKIYTNKDSFIIKNAATIYNNKPIAPQKNIKINLFTDRKLYRPGQTIYFKGIVIENYGKERKILANKTITITFYDVNWQKISSQKLISNDFGSFNGSFAIPQGLLNGSMTLQTNYGSTNIRIEEYKRPTFEVKLKAPDKQYTVNQKVTIKGTAKNYAGVNLTDAQVQYTIYRKNIWFGWWWQDFGTSNILISNGTTKTNDKGVFQITFDAIPDLAMPKNHNTAFCYTVYVDVTDLNGETQSGARTVTVGYTAMKLSTQMPSLISVQKLKEKKYLKIIAQNLNNQNIDAKGTINIYSLQNPHSALNKKYWQYPDQPIYSKKEWYKKYPGNEYKQEADFMFWQENKLIWNTNFNTAISKQINIKDLHKLKPGIYKIKISSKDAFGNDVNSVAFFKVFDEKNSIIPYSTNNWAININPKAEVGSNAKFIIGTKDKSRIIMQVSLGDKILFTKYINLNNEQKIVEYPVKENMRGGFNVSFINITNNRIYSKNFFIRVPYTNKKLDFEFATFRDKLQPGQKEQWKLIIKDKKGDAALAELMTFMYDASLDALYPYYFNFSLYPINYNHFKWKAKTFSSENSINNNFIHTKNYVYTKLQYRTFNWFGFFYEGNMRREMLYEKNADKNQVAVTPLTAPKIDNHTDNETQNNIAKTKNSKLNSNNKNKIQIRKNFNETAFFYPDLQTDKNGNVIISFTIPESLTKWRFRGLAYTKDLKFGIFDKYIVSQKDLMVMPNAPRFFRQGDTLFFAAKIANLSDKKLKGKVSLEFINEITGKIVKNIIVSKQKQNFSVDKGKNTPVKWKIIIPDNTDLLTYKIIAKAGNFSDGEQKTIPVLSNRMLVTEAMPLPVRANQTKTFKFTKLINSANSSTIKTHKLTVEFTSNPAWYAVQALPYLIEYPYECNEQTFTRLYANTLASFIANSSPKIKAVFDTWKNYQPSALESNLEKNQDLKSILLQETPWVLNAQNENERKHRIALLFDLNRMANEQQKALKKLKKAQSINGGWSWFPGMEESWRITQYIAEGIGHLMKLNVISAKNADFYNMGKKAIDFTDYKMLQDYKYIKKNYSKKQMKKLNVEQLIIHYFYTRSFYNIPLKNKYKEAYNYFYSQMKKYWTDYSIYSQAMMSLIFYRSKDENLAKLIVKSLSERAIHNDELGMYWKKNIAGYYWYQDPIQTQALMIELYNEVAKNKSDVDELKIWLLKNKQTNDWKTTTATAEAIYSLLLTNGVKLLANSKICPVTLGNITINPENNPEIKTEAGTGYYKVSFNGNKVTPAMGNIKVENKNNTVAWGAVYWQYFENLDKITPHKTPLKLKKELFKEIITDRGSQLLPLNKTNNLKIGDKIIVRIELRVDREMEYVHMKDMRASAFEPINVISQYKYQDGLGYYQTTKDASTNFFFDHLPKGTYVFQYSLRVSAEGSFSNGITTIQCMYAPEFMSHSKGLRVKIK